jgi:peptidase A4-like protein
VRPRRMTAKLALGLFALACSALACASPALGLASPAPVHTSPSANWAGYAVHRAGASFRQVVGTWREPTLSCRKGQQTFSSYWVGLGGYSTRSKALEQTGTEVDCTSTGRVRAFAWFELVPAASVRVRLRVPPGDLIQGAVSVTGRLVRVSLRDLTRHTAFSRVLHARVLDVTSAEWIVEAPSACLGSGRCVTLPLADFGRARFNNSMVQAAGGRLGPISDADWRTTRIRLTPGAQHEVSSHQGFGPGGGAVPSALGSQGSAFTVSFSSSGAGARVAATRPLLDVGRLVHGAR